MREPTKALYLLDQNMTVHVRRFLVTKTVQFLGGYAGARGSSNDCVGHVYIWGTISRDSIVKIHVIRLYIVSCNWL